MSVSPNMRLTNMPILKCHGSGNDFVMIDEYDLELDISEEQRRLLVISLCDRKGPVGADGVLFFSKSRLADAKTRILNADGSEPELCGNGTRCLARYAYEKLGKPVLRLETMRSVYTVCKEENIYNHLPTFSVEIDTVTFEAARIPIQTNTATVADDLIPGFYEPMRFYGLSLTNPHLVSIVDKVAIKLLKEMGSKANSNKQIFPAGMNLSFCRILAKGAIQVETFERGVGLTYSCGTAMSASTLVFCLRNPENFGKYVDVLNEGGMVKCCAHKSGDKYSIRLLGNATFVFKANIDFDFADPDSLNLTALETNYDEIAAYDKLLNYSMQKLSQLGVNMATKKMDPHFTHI